MDICNEKIRKQLPGYTLFQPNKSIGSLEIEALSFLLPTLSGRVANAITVVIKNIIDSAGCLNFIPNSIPAVVVYPVGRVVI